VRFPESWSSTFPLATTRCHKHCSQEISVLDNAFVLIQGHPHPNLPSRTKGAPPAYPRGLLG
jgi:hypothetical protein